MYYPCRRFGFFFHFPGWPVMDGKQDRKINNPSERMPQNLKNLPAKN
jgi:hypothetical protein